MNNLKYYDDYLNEGFYDWMQVRYNANDPNNIESGIMGFGIFFSIISQLVHMVTVNHIVVFMIGIALNSYSIAIFLRFALRNLYNSLRARKLLNQTNVKYKRIKELIEKYPDIEMEADRIKEEMINAVEENDREKTSKCIHDIYELSKNLGEREKLGEFFDMTDDEKKEIRAKIEDKKKKIIKKKEELKKVDPYGEEKWEDEKQNWWEKS